MVRGVLPRFDQLEVHIQFAVLHVNVVVVIIVAQLRCNVFEDEVVRFERGAAFVVRQGEVQGAVELQLYETVHVFAVEQEQADALLYQEFRMPIFLFL